MPSPRGEGGPTGRVWCSRDSGVKIEHNGCFAAYTSSVTFGDSFPSRGSLERAKQQFTAAIP